MENTPTIILFWIFAVAIAMLAVVSMVVAIVLLTKSKTQGAKQMKVIGNVFFALSILCFIPVLLVAGYILYIYIG